MRLLPFLAPLLAGLFYSQAISAAGKISDTEAQLLIDLTAPGWGPHTVCIKDAYGKKCTSAYECPLPAEWSEIYVTGRSQKYEVRTDCVDWSMDCPYGGIKNRPGDTCRWNINGGYIQIWLTKFGFIIEETY